MGYYGKWIKAAALAGFFSIFNVSLAQALTASETMTIQVNVTPYMSYNVNNSVSSVVLTRVDTILGFKNYPQATTVNINSNLTSGVALSVTLNDVRLTDDNKQVYKSGTFTVDGITYNLTPGGSTILNVPYNGAPAQSKVFSFKFIINKKIKPGTYAWPISITASPL